MDQLPRFKNESYIKYYNDAAIYTAGMAFVIKSVPKYIYSGFVMMIGLTGIALSIFIFITRKIVHLLAGIIERFKFAED